MGQSVEALKKAFPYTIPVLTGYLFMGAAFGVMFADMGYSVLWAILMSTVVYAGSGQYLAVNFFVPGLSLVGRYNKFGRKRWYTIFGMSDETYSLVCTTEVPKDVSDEDFVFSITLLDHLYWILGAALGSILAATVRFNSQGIEFAMTALFLVMFIELWYRRNNRLPELIGVLSTLVCLIVFGADTFVLPAMLVIIGAIFVFRTRIEKQEGRTDA